LTTFELSGIVFAMNDPDKKELDGMVNKFFLTFYGNESFVRMVMNAKETVDSAIERRNTKLEFECTDDYVFKKCQWEWLKHWAKGTGYWDYIDDESFKITFTNGSNIQLGIPKEQVEVSKS